MYVTVTQSVWQDVMPDKFIIRLYAAGLYLAECTLKPRDNGSTSSSGKDGAAMQYFLVKSNGLDNLSCLLEPLGSYFPTISSENHSSFHDKCEYLHGQAYPGSVSEDDIFSSSKWTKKDAYLPSYVNSLKFLCHPLAEVVNLERGYLLAGDQVDFSLAKLGEIQTVLSISCDIYVFYCRLVSKHFVDSYLQNEIFGCTFDYFTVV